MALTHLIDILTAVALCGSIIGGGVRAVSKLTKIADAVDRLSGTIEHLVATDGDHERRLDKLENTPRTRRSPAARS